MRVPVRAAVIDLAKLVPGLLKQESAQALILANGSLWFFWQHDAPMPLLYMVAALGGIFVIAEKWRAARVGSKPLVSGD